MVTQSAQPQPPGIAQFLPDIMHWNDDYISRCVNADYDDNLTSKALGAGEFAVSLHYTFLGVEPRKDRFNLNCYEVLSFHDTI